MSRHRNPRPNVPKQPPTHNPPRYPTDPRPHVAAMLELAALGWRVVEIGPDAHEPPVLWRVSIRRYDGNVTMSIDEADPDAALDELLHYAAADEDEPSVELPSAEAKPEKGTPENTPPSVGSRTRDELEAALNALGWEVVTGPVLAGDNWTATMRRGTTNVPMTGVEELDLFESLVRYAEHYAKTRKP